MAHTDSDKWYMIREYLKTKDFEIITEMREAGKYGKETSHLASQLALLGDIKFYVEKLDREGTSPSAATPQHQSY